MGSRDAMQGVGESIGLSRADHWSSGDKAAKHLPLDGMQSGSNSFSLLCECPEIRADVHWSNGFWLCSTFNTICHDKSVVLWQ